MIQLTIKNEETYAVKEGTSLYEALSKRKDAEHIYAVILNNKLHDLRYRVHQDTTIQLIYDEDPIGQQIHERTLSFLFIVAVYKKFPSAVVHMEHSFSKGIYLRIEKSDALSEDDISLIKDEMNTMIANKERIKREIISTNDAISYFERVGLNNKAALLKTHKSPTISIYELCGYHDYFYGLMLPDVSYIRHFSIRYYAAGVWLSSQDDFQPQKKLFRVFEEYEEWGRRIQISNVAQLNKHILAGNMNEIVLMSETMMEKKLSALAESIVYDHPSAKFILVAGPSSAGKTTFSKRLAIHFVTLGKHPVALSMDNFYRNIVDCPILEDGSYDFECLEALDVDLFNEVMGKLLHHEAVKLPHFNFTSGLREWEEHETLLKDEDLLIIEGIHALCPTLLPHIPKEAKFKIYINALTHLNLDDHNRISTSDYRLLRRIARDYQFRSWNAQETITIRKNVRDGEEKYIYPYQEDADAIFNSSLVYELPILKKIVMPLLHDVPITNATYLEAKRLYDFLNYFVDGKESAVPRSSILAEFIGNSIFDI